MDVIGQLDGTPYLLDVGSSVGTGLAKALAELEDRVVTLRHAGTLSAETIEKYYGDTRIWQVTESNALEGSTLGRGETALAVEKGVTLTGHDPAYQRDAKTLYEALGRVAKLAKAPGPTTLEELHQVHACIFGDRPSGGVFRSSPVRISGSQHIPPKTWQALMEQMEAWERWSREHSGALAPLRTAVLHAWLAHVHPYIDGNGRTARAVGNLELIRHGYPPLIIRKKDRKRYLSALAQADDGDLAPFCELIFDRADDALRDLERTAKSAQGYDPTREKIHIAQERMLAVWNGAVELLFQAAANELAGRAEANGFSSSTERFGNLEIDEYLTLSNRGSIRHAWMFVLACRAAGIPQVERLAWAGFQSPEMRSALPKGSAGGPSLFWSARNSQAYPPWRTAHADAPVGIELTIVPGTGDRWFARTPEGAIKTYSLTELATGIAIALVDQLGR